MVAVYDLKKAFNIYFRLKKKALKVEDPEFSSDGAVINSAWGPDLDFGLRDAGNRRPIFVDMIGRANRKTTGSPGKSKGPRPKIKGQRFLADASQRTRAKKRKAKGARRIER